MLAVLSVIAVVTVVVISAWKSSGGEHATKAPRKTHPKAQVTRAGPYLVVKGLGGSSKVTIRRGGPGGAVVFDGTVERGEAVPSRARATGSA